uniref:Ribosomal_S7 domain-containing protein n=1 Tax=Pristionchus pacificus TaxID=54126 RepID=A0A8R1V2M3_PRIPA
VNVADISLVDYITVKEKYAKYLPHSAGRYQNPVQVLVNAIIMSAPLYSYWTRRCRVNQAMWLLGTGAHEAAFRNIKTIAECLAEELINAAKESPNNYAIKKKDEPERVAQFNV